MEIRSPITGSTNVKIIEQIPAIKIIKMYKDYFDIDVARFFQSIETIFLCKCNDSNLEFFYPQNIDGDGKFYELLQRFPWYYMEQKWEYTAVLKYIKKSEKLLEVGCAQGSFLNSLPKNQELELVGIDLNEDAIKKARGKGLNASVKTIQEVAKNNKDSFDIVCSFQVLEHIQDIKSFIQSSIDCLKVGGKFIFSVPNNDSFIRLDKEAPLNKPPHHMCLWKKDSITSLPKFFNLKLVDILYEALQSYHFNYYINILLTHLNVKRRMYKIPLKFILQIYLIMFSRFMKGHSIVGVYTKI